MSRASSTSLPVQALLVGVQRALSLLVPVANDLGVHWRDPDNYDDWDNVASGIFDGFALEAIRSSVGWTGCAPLIGYDRRITDYSKLSYVAVQSSRGLSPLVCFETSSDPFDTCLVADLEPDLKVKGHLRLPFGECQFVAVGCISSGQQKTIDTVTW